jgi:Abnormal spindle-like microcephaly-assoc'd, ASPM-SPD-2-Hydin/Beta-propeller repeat
MFRFPVLRTAAFVCLFLAIAPIDTKGQTKQPFLSASPLVFEQNEGQAPPMYQFLARRDGVETLYFADGMDIFVSKPRSTASQLRILWTGANRKSLLLGEDRQPGRSNYFHGSDPIHWLRNVPQFAVLRYHQIYPGIDLLFHGSGDELEHDFLIEAGADPAELCLHIDWPARVTSSGDLQVDLGKSVVRLRKPVAYQEFGGTREKVEASFVLAADGQVKFRVGKYDHGRPLVVDPVFGFSTYLAGTGADQMMGVTTDSAGNIYVTGSTSSTDFPLAHPEQSACDGCGAFNQNSDAYVSKLDPTGHTLLYSTYLGGSSTNLGVAIAVDGNGNIIISGRSSSPDFPTSGALPASASCLNGINCFFVASFRPDGSALNYSGRLGGVTGSFNDFKNLAVDSAGNAYLTGATGDSQFPLTPGTLGPTSPGYPGTAAFVLKLDPTGRLVYGTTIPGNAPVVPGTVYANNFPAAGISVDTNGQVTLAGQAGLGLPTTPGVLQAAIPSAPNTPDPVTGYLLQLNANATALNYATYLPGVSGVGGLAVDGSGNSYVVGYTNQSDLPVSANAYQKTRNDSQNSDSTDGYILKINAQATTVLAGTYLGGTQTLPMEGTYIAEVALDSKSNVLVGGSTASVDFPLKNPFVATLQTGATSYGLVVAELSPDLSSLVFGSFLSSNSYLGASDFAGLAIDPQDNAVVIGNTSAIDFPTTPNSFEPALPAPPSSLTTYPHGFISKLDLATPAPSVCVNPNPINLPTTLVNTAGSLSLMVTNCGNAPLQISSVTSTLPTVTATQTCGSIAPAATCAVQLTFTPTDTNVSTGTLTLTDNAAIPQQTLPMNGQGGVPSINFPVSPISTGDALVGTHIETPWLFVNTGDGAWIVSNATAVGDFAVDNQCTTPVPGIPPTLTGNPVNNICQIGVIFAPTAAGVRTGTLTITDNAPGSPHVIQLTGNGVLTYATPGISSVNATASDAQPPEINIVGTNFFPTSQVFVNGSPRTTHYYGEQLIYADAKPADIAQVGELSVTVSTPAPGGGVSNTFPWDIYAAIRNIYVLHAVYEPHSALLYASISPTSPTHANDVIVIDPTTASIVQSWSVGNGPDPLAVSDDGKLLYVGLDGDMKVAQIALPGGTVNFSTSLGNTPNSSIPMVANALVVFPGQPHSWAVAQNASQPTFPPYGQGIAVYDDAVQRPTAYLPGGTDWSSLLFIGGNTNFLYAISADLGPSTYGQFSISSAGITSVQSDFSDSGAAYNVGGLLDTDGTSLYANNGQVINPTNLAITYPFPNLNSNIPGIKVDVPASRVYFSGALPFGNFGFDYEIEAFDLASQNLVGTIAFNEGMQRSDLFRWSTNGMLVDTSLGIFVLRTSLTSGVAPPVQFGVTGLTPATALAGSGDLAVKIGGSGFAAGDTVTANNVVLAPTIVSASEIDITVPASLLTAVGGVQLAITSPANQTAYLVLTIGPSGPVASVAPGTLSFASLIVGVASPTQNVTLSNGGTAALVVSNVAVSGDFSQTNTCATVVPGGNCSIGVVFKPTATGARTGTLTITDNGGANPQTIALTGNGSDIQITTGNSGASAAVAAGQSANYTLSITPTGGFAGEVTFSCTNLPQYAACTITPPSANLSSASVSATVTITTMQQQTAMLDRTSTNIAFAGLSWFGLFALLPLWRLRHALSRAGLGAKMVVWLLVIGTTIASISLAGCGGGSTSTPASPSTPTSLNTPAGTYGVNFVATTSGVSRTIPLTLVVQ